MSHIVIYPSSISVVGNNLHVSGVARVNVANSDEFSWDATISWTASQTAVNTAIQNAAIAAAENLDYTVGLLDNKIILGGAAGI